MSLNIIGYYLIILHVNLTKFQNNSFVKYIVSNKNAKRTFLSSEVHPDDFSKILFYGNKINHNTSICAEFHDRRPNSLGREELQGSHRSGHIRASLTNVILKIFA